MLLYVYIYRLRIFIEVMLKTMFQDNIKQAYILSTVHKKKKKTLQISLSHEKEMTDGKQVWHMHDLACLHDSNNS